MRAIAIPANRVKRTHPTTDAIIMIRVLELLSSSSSSSFADVESLMTSFEELAEFKFDDEL